jgi:hypothetical protein
MNSITQSVNDILIRNLLGASVESFGLTHQFLTLTFRDNRANPDDHTLSIDTEIFSNCQDFDNLPIDDIGRGLLLFNNVNLKTITAIQCNDEATLEIQFENGIVITFNGHPIDELAVEPWTIGNNCMISDPSYYSIIAMNDGAYAVFGGTPESA